jgi:hypothetical protein
MILPPRRARPNVRHDPAGEFGATIAYLLRHAKRQQLESISEHVEASLEVFARKMGPIIGEDHGARAR